MMPSLLGQPSIPGRSNRDRTEDRKSVLFCQSCGHESPVDGDWRIARVDRRTECEQVIYTCPECARTVSVRPVDRRPRTRTREQAPSGDRLRSRDRPARAP